MSDETVTMPFGKHKGEQLGDIPTEYLDYILGWDKLYDDLRKTIEAHLKTREDEDTTDD